ncbi:frizzled-4-like [Clavelina lepadiformis]|uniref:frizzled-4-like n=1 Tax=Clavelina lepadiformis TaxID=159417 RepID=UPI0040429DC5
MSYILNTNMFTSGLYRKMCQIYVFLIAAQLTFGTRGFDYGQSNLPGKRHVSSFSPSQPMFGGSRRCEKLKIKQCYGTGYNYTQVSPEYERQIDAELDLNSYQPLIQYNCSSQLLFFLCVVHAPMCNETVSEPIGPCETMCRAVEKSCRPFMESFGLSWPKALNCSKFPPHNTPETMCMEGEKEDTPAVIRPPKPPLEPPSYSHCAEPQITLKQAEQKESCAWKCGYQQGMFSPGDKDFADLWMAVWSGLCFLSTTFTVLTFLIDASRFRYPERPIIFLAMCYNIYCISYILRLLVGRDNISCERNDEGDMFLIQNGLSNTGCAIIFLLSYFFGMASCLWWVILTLTWFLAAGMKWSHEAIEMHSSYFHLVAWSIPSIKIVIILIMRQVDGDELTGLCYVGNQDTNALTGFVLAPLFTYLVIGTSFLFAGFVSLFRIKTYMKREGSKTDKLQRLMLKIGIFSVLYIVPASIVIGCYFYEHSNRRLWSTNATRVHPSTSIYLLRILMQLIIGVFTGCWVWSKKTMQTWKTCSQSMLVLTPSSEYSKKIYEEHHQKDINRQNRALVKQGPQRNVKRSSNKHEEVIHVPQALMPVFTRAHASNNVTVYPAHYSTMTGRSQGLNDGFQVPKTGEILHQPLLNGEHSRIEGYVIS